MFHFDVVALSVICLVMGTVCFFFPDLLLSTKIKDKYGEAVYQWWRKLLRIAGVGYYVGAIAVVVFHILFRIIWV